MNPSLKKEMKTDAQREVLERSYEIDRFPQEHARQELARQTGLTEKQVVVWFSHRRRKDRKAESILSGEPTNITGGGAHPTTATAANLDERDARVAAANAARAAEAAQAAVKAAQEAAQYARDVEARIKQKREDLHAKIVQKLGFAPRADGPRCALSDAEFDPLPPGAFGAKGRRPANNTASAAAKSKRAAGEVESQAIKRQRKEMENQLRLHEKQAAKERELARRREEAMARERAKEEERMRKEHERSVRAMEKLAAEQMRREAMFERERRREEEKLERERLKLEERRERERRREEERLERERMKEEAKEARRVELEDRKRERDEEKERERERREKARALIALGPPDDEALELESLRVEKLQAAGHSDVVPRTALELVTAGKCPAAACDGMEESMHKLTPAEQLLLTPPVTTPLPRFPPPAVRLVDSGSAATFMGCAAEGGGQYNSTTALNLGDSDWPDLLEVWSFVNEFSEATGCTACTLCNFATALIKGSGSNLLATVHIKLMQTLLADMNEAHAQSSQIAKTTDELQGIGATLREAWSWVFDVDAWRAHLNHMTWPEVMRQFATAAGHGKQRSGVSTNTSFGSMGAGSTAVEKAMDDHGLLQKNGIFQPPRRFQPGSVRAFCWVVLEKTGPEGMSIPAIAKAISEKGFRDLRSTKTLGTSLAGVLSRDPTFVKTAHSTYALRCRLIVSRQEAGEDFADLLTDTGISPADLVGSLDSSPVTGFGDEVNGRVNSDEIKNEDHAGGKDKEVKLINVDKLVVDADWVRHLEEGDYDTLTLRERLDALLMLVHTALDGGAVRGIIEARVERCNALRKGLTVDHISKRKAARLARRRAKNSAEGLVTSAGDGKGGGEGGEDDDDEDEGPGSGELSAEDFRARHALAEKIRAAEEELGITLRHAPIALDRRFNRYWCFAAAGGKTPPAADGSPALLYLEHAPGGYFHVSNKEDADDDCRIAKEEPKWSLLDGAGAIASLVSCLDPRGRREQALYAALHTRGSCVGADGAMTGSPELFGAALEAAMPTSPPLPRPATADDTTMEVLAIRTVAAEITARDAAAPLMLAAKRGGNPPSPAALRLHKIRAEILNIIRSLPQSAFHHASEAGEEKKRWEQATTTATTITELRNALARLQEAISPRYFSASFVLRSVDPTVVQSSATPATKSTGENFIPATSAALALHVLSLDAALNYSPSRAPARETLASYIYIQRPANTALSGMRKGLTRRKRSSSGPSALKVVIKKAGGGRKDAEADQNGIDDGEAHDNRLEEDDEADEEGEDDELEEEFEEDVDDEEYEEEEEEEDDDEYVGEDDDDDEDFCA